MAKARKPAPAAQPPKMTLKPRKGGSTVKPAAQESQPKTEAAPDAKAG